MSGLRQAPYISMTKKKVITRRRKRERKVLKHVFWCCDIYNYTGQPLHEVIVLFLTFEQYRWYIKTDKTYRNTQDCLMFYLQWVLKLQCAFSVEFKRRKTGFSICIESSGTAYNHHNSVYLLPIVSTPFDHAHYPLACNFCSCTQTSWLAWSMVVSCPVSF